MAVDVLLFGAHPDDVEWGAGGIMLLMKQHAMSFAIVDLTAGEMGSRGTAEERDAEAQAASQFAGAAVRECLNMPDCGLVDSVANRRAIASVIRRFQPRLVLAPYWEDRHPDHAAAGAMVRNSALFCTLRKFDDANAPQKPEAFLYFLLHHYEKPSLVVDVSAVYEKKMQLLRLHHSQFSKTATGFGVLAQGMDDYLYGLESRDRFFGALVGARHGEALVVERPLRMAGLGGLVG